MQVSAEPPSLRISPGDAATEVEQQSNPLSTAPLQELYTSGLIPTTVTRKTYATTQSPVVAGGGRWQAGMAGGGGGIYVCAIPQSQALGLLDYASVLHFAQGLQFWPSNTHTRAAASRLIRWITRAELSFKSASMNGYTLHASFLRLVLSRHRPPCRL